MRQTPLTIDYFSDLLCIWAYAAQIRIDELQRQFGQAISVRPRFMTVFGDTGHRIGEGWRERGGFAGFNRHIQEVAARFPHVEVHPELWQRVQPASSGTAHHYLKAVGLWQASGDAPANALEHAAWALRLAFFRDARNIAEQDTVFQIGEEQGIPRREVEPYLRDGRAMAAFCRDVEDCEKHRIEGSPTLLLNEGRQKLYGNVGYRVIEPNVQELLKQPSGEQASWG